MRTPGTNRRCKTLKKGCTALDCFAHPTGSWVLMRTLSDISYRAISGGLKARLQRREKSECPEHSLQSREAVAGQNEVSNLGPVQFSICAETNPSAGCCVGSREKSFVATEPFLFLDRCPKGDAGPAVIVIE